MDGVDFEYVIVHQTMEEEIDIYENLPHFEVGSIEQIDRLQERIQILENHIAALEKDVEQLSLKLVELKKTKQILSSNLSALFKTARAEIERKDRRIAELQKQVEQFQCERRLAGLTKRPREESVSEAGFKKPRKDEPPSNRGHHYDRDYEYRERHKYGDYSRNRSTSYHSSHVSNNERRNEHPSRTKSSSKTVSTKEKDKREYSKEKPIKNEDLFTDKSEDENKNMTKVVGIKKEQKPLVEKSKKNVPRLQKLDTVINRLSENKLVKTEKSSNADKTNNRNNNTKDEDNLIQEIKSTGQEQAQKVYEEVVGEAKGNFISEPSQEASVEVECKAQQFTEILTSEQDQRTCETVEEKVGQLFTENLNSSEVPTTCETVEKEANEISDQCLKPSETVDNKPSEKCTKNLTSEQAHKACEKVENELIIEKMTPEQVQKAFEMVETIASQIFTTNLAPEKSTKASEKIENTSNHKHKEKPASTQIQNVCEEVKNKESEIIDDKLTEKQDQKACEIVETKANQIVTTALTPENSVKASEKVENTSNQKHTENSASTQIQNVCEEVKNKESEIFNEKLTEKQGEIIEKEASQILSTNLTSEETNQVHKEVEENSRSTFTDNLSSGQAHENSTSKQAHKADPNEILSENIPTKQVEKPQEKFENKTNHSLNLTSEKSDKSSEKVENAMSQIFEENLFSDQTEIAGQKLDNKESIESDIRDELEKIMESDTKVSQTSDCLNENVHSQTMPTKQDIPLNKNTNNPKKQENDTILTQNHTEIEKITKKIDKPLKKPTEKIKQKPEKNCIKINNKKDTKDIQKLGHSITKDEGKNKKQDSNAILKNILEDKISNKPAVSFTGDLEQIENNILTEISKVSTVGDTSKPKKDSKENSSVKIRKKSTEEKSTGKTGKKSTEEKSITKKEFGKDMNSVRNSSKEIKQSAKQLDNILKGEVKHKDTTNGGKKKVDRENMKTKESEPEKNKVSNVDLIVEKIEQELTVMCTSPVKNISTKTKNESKDKKTKQESCPAKNNERKTKCKEEKDKNRPKTVENVEDSHCNTPVQNAAKRKRSESREKKDKVEEIPESSRVLRSASKKNQKENEIPSVLDPSTIKTFSESTVNLSHDGDIPVLHLSDSENFNNDINASLFDLSLSKQAGLTSSPIKKCINMDLLRQDLEISMDQSQTETATPSNLSDAISQSTTIVSTVNGTRSLNTSRKRRRVVLSFVD